MATKKARRFGSIEQRGPSKHLVRLFTGYDGEGKRQYNSQTIQGTKKDAEDALAKMRTQFALGQVSGREHEMCHVKQLLDLVLRDYQNNEKDYRWAEGVVRVRLFPYFRRVESRQSHNRYYRQLHC